MSKAVIKCAHESGDSNAQLMTTKRYGIDMFMLGYQQGMGAGRVQVVLAVAAVAIVIGLTLSVSAL